MMRSLLINLFVCSVSIGAGGVEKPTLLFEQDPTLLNTTIQVMVLTGSADDPADKRGLNNLVGEIILRGTKRKNRTKFQSAVERLGATLAVSTSDDNLSVVGEVIKENTDAFLDLIEETLFYPSFPDSEFKALKKEVLADISHSKNNNMRLSGLALRKVMFDGTVMETPGEGSLKSVKKITRKDVIKAYNKAFHQGNLVFAVASPLPLSKIEKKITRIWKRFPKGKAVKRTPIEPKLAKKPTLILIHKPNTSTGSILFGQKGITISDEARYDLGVGNFSFGSEPLVSRLFKVIRSELGWTYSIGTTYSAMGSLNEQPGIFVIATTPSIEFTSKTMLKVIEMWQKYMKSGLESSELKLARESLVNSYAFEFDSAKKRLSLKLREHLYGIPTLSDEAYTETIEDITNKDILKALKSHHSADGWYITLVADKKVIEEQLAKEQKDIPKNKRLTISKVLTPDQLID